MENTEKYELLAEEGISLPSNIGILPYSTNLQFSEEIIKNSLSNHSDWKLLAFEKSEDNDTDSPEKNFVATIEYDETEYEIDIYIVETKVNLREYGFANAIDEESLKIAEQQQWMLETSMYFNGGSLTSFHLQLKVMNAIVPDASLVIDYSSYRLLSAKWLKLAATSAVPPSPNYLYTIHGVYDEKEGEKQYWLHTHGLHRCGSVELEILNFNENAENMNTLINMSVKKFLTDPVQEKEKFAIGYDGLGLNLAWLRWEEALKDIPKDMLGGFNDRKNDDGENVHAEPSGILFAVEDGELVSPMIYNKTISEDPVFFITTEESNRMSAMAKERFPYFQRAFEREISKPEKKSFFKKLFSKQENKENEWSFLVKLGLTTDNNESETEKEHLWFEVQSIQGNNIEGKLLNQPYWIANLSEGDIRTYPLDLLTDWMIYAPDVTYSPDMAYMME